MSVERHPDSAVCALARRFMRMVDEGELNLDALPPLSDLTPRPVKVERVIRYICVRYSVSRRALLSQARTRSITKARGEACRQLRYLEYSFHEISGFLNVHHTIPIYHCRPERQH